MGRLLIDVIAGDYDLKPPKFPVGYVPTAPELQAKLRAWLKSIPAETQALPPKTGQPPFLFPAGKYDWGDD